MCFTIKLLGSFEASVHDVSVAPSAAKQRQLLALLALNAGRSVPVPTIMGELWGPDQTKAAGTTLHTYIGKLRRELGTGQSGQDAKRILVTEPAGYSLRVPDSNIDTGRYEQLAQAGRLASDHGDHEAASRNLGAALSLWRGPALSDIVPGQHLMVEIVRLEESRLADLDLRIESDLRLGRHRKLLGELAGLHARYPMSENFGTKYMLALYRSGEQWRALEVYQRLRATMNEELGVDPSAGLQRLHLAMLRGDPAVDAPAPDLPSLYSAG
ncbi:AfsR/SARP family transcriptional regulator [Actinocrispum sp. NPDC049592]|uniref:AfsR/SARP family transcriptional regulator n=1 Tax=Actinocrispum sp. NPDC049592 TaxID=3154835 RepID=UPI00341BC643